MLEIIVDNVRHSLNDGTLCWWLNHDGLGMAPMHRLEERGPLQDGDTDRGYRLDPRIIQLILEIDKDSLHTLNYARNQLISLFRPKPESIVLCLTWPIYPTTPTGEENPDDPWERQFYINCHYVGDMTMPSADKKGYSQVVVITLKANDPTFYEGIRHLIEFGGGSTGSGLAFPMPFPFLLGTSSMVGSYTINAQGTADDYPEITIVGPITNPIIENHTYGWVLDFTGTTINAAVTYVIDLRYGYKTVMEGTTNRISKLTADSDLTSWRLKPGYNDIHVTGSSVTGATKVQIRYYDRYLGV